MEIELEYLSVFSMYLFIENLLSSSRGVIEFQEMIFQLIYHGSAVTQHPQLSKGNPERGVTQSPSSWFSGGGEKKKRVLKAVAVIYAKCYGKERDPKGRGEEVSICRLDQVN